MNYPSGIKKINRSTIPITTDTYKNRGMNLEDELNQSNKFYRDIDKAFIYKKPTPIKITKVDYPSRDRAVIKEAFFTIPSTTDYNGIYKGYYIDFEAKESKSTTSFALSNIHPHQIKHLENIEKHKGISFLIIRFTSLNETYLLPTKNFLAFLKESERKSIPLDFIKKNAYLIKDGYNPRIDYLKIVDKLIEDFGGTR